MQLFQNAERFRRFVSYIAIPEADIGHFQIGLLTTHALDCDDTMLSVFSQTGDSAVMRVQCVREPRYDAMGTTLSDLKRCVFECHNTKFCASFMRVSVQFERMPWKHGNGMDIWLCEIEAYAF